MRSGRALVLSDYAGGGSAAQGGAGHAVLDSFHALAGAGMDVRLVAGFGTPSVADPAQVVMLGGEDLREAGGAGAVRAVYNPAARAALKPLLAREDPDTTVIILHQWTRFLSPAAIGLLAPFRVMIYMHDYFWPCPNGAYYDFREREPCHRRPLGAACAAADCDRDGRAAKLGRLARHVVLQAETHWPADHRLFLHLSRRAHRTAAPLLPGEWHAEVTNWLAVPDVPPPPPASPTYDFGYFGRLEPEKGVGLLIDAAAGLGLVGLFVGRGSLEDAIRTAPGQDLALWRPRADMPAAMRSCRVVVLPSLWRETWGLATAEAMAAGVPVLVSGRAGSAELVERFGGGAIFDPAVPGDLEAKLRRIAAEGRPIESERWAAFARHLSAARHAERVVVLGREHWGIDLNPPSPRATAPAAPQAVPLHSAR